MDLLRVEANEYNELMTNHLHVFNTIEFAELNKDKCIQVHYLIIRNKKVRFGIILGEKENGLYSPFSAPCGGFDYFREEPVEYYDEAVRLLKGYGESVGKKIHIVLPPMIYNETHISKTISALYRHGGEVEYLDLNNHYDLARFKNYDAYIARMARKNLNNSIQLNLPFIKLNTQNPKDVERAYEVIKKNREARGFPLRMSLQAVLDTVSILDADFFIMTYEGVDVAAGQVYRISPEINQVIYWGNIVEYAHLRVMNIFTYKVFEYYCNQGGKILDIGISTDHSEPNYGLCDFKESIGCEFSLKYTIKL